MASRQDSLEAAAAVSVVFSLIFALIFVIVKFLLIYPGAIVAVLALVLLWVSTYIYYRKVK